MKRFYSLVSIMLFVLTISFANINTVKAVENLEQENEITEEVIQKEDVEIQEKKEEIDLSLLNNRNEDEGKENEIQSTPGQVTGDKTAEVVTGDGEDGRSADVTIIVKGEEFDETSTEEREIVLVLDVSGSMNEEIESRKTKIDALIESANELINSLLSEENINTTTVGIVFYSTKAESFCNLTNDKGVLKECLKSIKAEGATNVQAGIKTAKELFSDNNNSKTIILLSDGEPTKYNDANGTEHGNGNTDNYENTEYFTDSDISYDIFHYKRSWTRTFYLDEAKTKVVMVCKFTNGGFNYDCTTVEEYRPSTKAKEEVQPFKNLGTIYTIGFGNVNATAQKFLEEMASSKDKYFIAGSIESLKDAFKAIVNQIDLIANDVKVTDIVPNTFEVDKDYLDNKFNSKEEQDDGSVTYKNEKGMDVLNVKENKDDTTTITWYIGVLKSTEQNDLTFRIKALNPYYGSMYTNTRATVTGIASDGNPFYTETKNIEFDLPLPSVVIPSVTDDNKYSVKQGETLNDNIRDNDYNGKLSEDGYNVNDQIIVVTGVSKGTLNVANDGSGNFTYLAPEDFYGEVNFTYYIKTIAIKNGKTYEVNSNTSTVIIDIQRIPTTYVVHHYIKGTTEKVAEDETGTGYVNEKATGRAILDLENYTLVDNVYVKTITLQRKGNVITFYYELKEAANITVHHYIKGTTEKVAEDDILTGKVTERFTANAHQDLDVYKLVSQSPSFVEGTFTLEEQEIIFYYEPVIGKLTVKYVDENGKKLTDEMVSEDQIKKAYKTSAKSFENYELVKVIGNEEGYYDVNDTEVVYVYRFVDKDIPNTGITNNYVLDVIFTVSFISLLGYAILKVKENN